MKVGGISAVILCTGGLLAYLSSAPVRAATLDWDTTGNWTAGAPAIGSNVTQSFNNDAGHAGNDVTIDLGNRGGNWGTGYPVVNTAYNGGTGQKTLAFNYATETTNNPDLFVNIQFNYTYGVTNVSFSIYDVDYNAGTWIDQIGSITALTLNGTIITANASMITTSLYNSYNATNGTVTGRTNNAGGNSSNGNVGINWGNQVVTAVSFTWANVDAARGDQKISLSDISYNQAIIPEVSPGLGASLVCTSILALMIASRKRSLSV